MLFVTLTHTVHFVQDHSINTFFKTTCVENTEVIKNNQMSLVWGLWLLSLALQMNAYKHSFAMFFHIVLN